MAESVLDTTVKQADGKDVTLNEFEGKVLLIVNVASKCGFTPQYAGLEKLYEKYKGQGLRILAFPCNQFGGQEPAPMDEILTFCSTNYGVTFDVFNKIEVNGPGRSPLYAKLTQTPPAGDIQWNFEKFVVDKNGEIVARFRPKTTPDDPGLVGTIEQALKA
jgi:glutathione peroxidase